MEFNGESIYKLRKSKGISQEKLAEMVGVSRQTIYKWESNMAFPNSENILSLYKAFQAYDMAVGTAASELAKPDFNESVQVKGFQDDSVAANAAKKGKAELVVDNGENLTEKCVELLVRESQKRADWLVFCCVAVGIALFFAVLVTVAMGFPYFTTNNKGGIMIFTIDNLEKSFYISLAVSLFLAFMEAGLVTFTVRRFVAKRRLKQAETLLKNFKEVKSVNNSPKK